MCNVEYSLIFSLSLSIYIYIYIITNKHGCDASVLRPAFESPSRPNGSRPRNIYIYIYIYIYVCIYVYMYICIYIYAHIHIYIYIYIYILFMFVCKCTRCAYVSIFGSTQTHPTPTTPRLINSNWIV